MSHPSPNISNGLPLNAEFCFTKGLQNSTRGDAYQRKELSACFAAKYVFLLSKCSSFSEQISSIVETQVTMIEQVTVTISMTKW